MQVFVAVQTTEAEDRDDDLRIDVFGAYRVRADAEARLFSDEDSSHEQVTESEVLKKKFKLLPLNLKTEILSMRS